MLTAILLFMSPSPPPLPPDPEPWELVLTVTAWDHEITMRLPTTDVDACEELREIWLVDGPRDTDEFKSESECVPIPNPQDTAATANGAPLRHGPAGPIRRAPPADGGIRASG